MRHNVYQAISLLLAACLLSDKAQSYAILVSNPPVHTATSAPFEFGLAALSTVAINERRPLSLGTPAQPRRLTTFSLSKTDHDTFQTILARSRNSEPGSNDGEKNLISRPGREVQRQKIDALLAAGQRQASMTLDGALRSLRNYQLVPRFKRMPLTMTVHGEPSAGMTVVRLQWRPDEVYFDPLFMLATYDGTGQFRSMAIRSSSRQDTETYVELQPDLLHDIELKRWAEALRGYLEHRLNSYAKLPPRSKKATTWDFLRPVSPVELNDFLADHASIDELFNQIISAQNDRVQAYGARASSLSYPEFLLNPYAFVLIKRPKNQEGPTTFAALQTVTDEAEFSAAPKRQVLVGFQGLTPLLAAHELAHAWWAELVTTHDDYYLQKIFRWAQGKNAIIAALRARDYRNEEMVGEVIADIAGHVHAGLSTLVNQPITEEDLAMLREFKFIPATALAVRQRTLSSA